MSTPRCTSDIHPRVEVSAQFARGPCGPPASRTPRRCCSSARLPCRSSLVAPLPHPEGVVEPPGRRLLTGDKVERRAIPGSPAPDAATATRPKEDGRKVARPYPCREEREGSLAPYSLFVTLLTGRVGLPSAYRHTSALTVSTRPEPVIPWTGPRALFRSAVRCPNIAAALAEGTERMRWDAEIGTMIGLVERPASAGHALSTARASWRLAASRYLGFSRTTLPWRPVRSVRTTSALSSGLGRP